MSRADQVEHALRAQPPLAPFFPASCVLGSYQYMLFKMLLYLGTCCSDASTRAVLKILWSDVRASSWGQQHLQVLADSHTLQVNAHIPLHRGGLIAASAWKPFTVNACACSKGSALLLACKFTLVVCKWLTG